MGTEERDNRMKDRKRKTVEKRTHTNTLSLVLTYKHTHTQTKTHTHTHSHSHSHKGTYSKTESKETVTRSLNVLFYCWLETPGIIADVPLPLLTPRRFVESQLPDSRSTNMWN